MISLSRSTSSSKRRHSHSSAIWILLINLFLKKPLTHFRLTLHFCIPWKLQKTSSLLTFSWGIEILHWHEVIYKVQKQPSRGIFRKRCSENMQQIYRRTPMPKCVNLMYIFRTPFPKNASGGLLLKVLLSIPLSLFIDFYEKKIGSTPLSLMLWISTNSFN